MQDLDLVLIFLSSRQHDPPDPRISFSPRGRALFTPVLPTKYHRQCQNDHDCQFPLSRLFCGVGKPSSGLYSKVLMYPDIAFPSIMPSEYGPALPTLSFWATWLCEEQGPGAPSVPSYYDYEEKF